MVPDERARHELYLRLQATIGADAATTLMEMLPPVGWADVATKRELDRLAQDLAALEERMSLKLGLLEQSLLHTFQRELRTAITSQTRILARTLVGTMLTTSGLAFAAAAGMG